MGSSCWQKATLNAAVQRIPDSNEILGWFIGQVKLN